MRTVKIKSIKSIGLQKTLDLEVNHEDHNFYAEGLVTSNSHSAAYATLSAITAYLKFKYPQQFFLSLLNMAKNEPDPRIEISKIEQELPDFNITLLPPCIIKSSLDFTLDGNNIRFGLCLIKGISQKAMDKILEFKKYKDSYKNKFELFIAAKDCKLSMGILSPLIQSGAFEDFRNNRSFMVLESNLWNILTEKEKKACVSLGEEYNFNLIMIVKALSKTLNDKGVPIIKPDRYETIKEKYRPYKDIYDINSANESFANWYYERQLMGYSCSKSLKDVLSEKYAYLVDVRTALEEEQGHAVRCVGTVVDCSSGTSPKGTKWYRLTLSDETGQMNVLTFNDAIEEIKSINNNKLPVKDNIAYVSGVKKNDAVFANMIYVEDSKIYCKLGDLTRDKEENKE